MSGCCSRQRASQSEFLDGLTEAAGIDWSRIEAFQLDEYVGLPPGDPQSFGSWLDVHIWSRVRPGRVEILDGGAAAAGPDVECARYGTLLAEAPIDLALIGVGENGHLAFNDPHVADFDDPVVVKPVEIDDTSRAQQVRDGAFASVDAVPSARDDRDDVGHPREPRASRSWCPAPRRRGRGSRCSRARSRPPVRPPPCAVIPTP